MTTPGATNGNNCGIMTNLGFQLIQYGVLDINQTQKVINVIISTPTTRYTDNDLFVGTVLSYFAWGSR